MDERAQGLIIRMHALTESSWIVHWLTPELGRVKTVAKGARRPKSPFRGKLDLFYEGDFSFARSRRSDLHALREVMLRSTHEPLRHELKWLQQASYAAALVEQTTEAETPLPTLHALLQEFVAVLPSRPPAPGLMLAFELRVLADQGLQPDLGASRLSPEARQEAGRLGHAPWAELAAAPAPAPVVAELRRFLQGFLTYHLTRIPRGRAEACGD